MPGVPTTLTALTVNTPALVDVPPSRVMTSPGRYAVPGVATPALMAFIEATAEAQLTSGIPIATVGPEV